MYDKDVTIMCDTIKTSLCPIVMTDNLWFKKNKYSSRIILTMKLVII